MNVLVVYCTQALTLAGSMRDALIIGNANTSCVL